MMDFEKLIVELIENLIPVVVEQKKGKDTVTYLEPNDKANEIMKQVEQWQLDSIEEEGVFYALKYQAEGGYDHGPFKTLAAALAANPDKGLLLYRVDTAVVMENGGNYFATRLYVGDGEKWVKCEV